MSTAWRKVALPGVWGGGFLGAGLVGAPFPRA